MHNKLTDIHFHFYFVNFSILIWNSRFASALTHSTLLCTWIGFGSIEMDKSENCYAAIESKIANVDCSINISLFIWRSIHFVYQFRAKSFCVIICNSANDSPIDMICFFSSFFHFCEFILVPTMLKGGNSAYALEPSIDRCSAALSWFFEFVFFFLLHWIWKWIFVGCAIAVSFVCIVQWAIFFLFYFHLFRTPTFFKYENLTCINTFKCTYKIYIVMRQRHMYL